MQYTREQFSSFCEELGFLFDLYTESNLSYEDVVKMVACIGMCRTRSYMEDLGIFINNPESETMIHIRTIREDDNMWYVGQKVKLLYKIMLRDFTGARHVDKDCGVRP